MAPDYFDGSSRALYPRGHTKPVFDAREREAAAPLFDPIAGAGSIRRTAADAKPARSVTAQIMGDPAPGRFPWN